MSPCPDYRSVSREVQVGDATDWSYIDFSLDVGEDCGFLSVDHVVLSVRQDKAHDEGGDACEWKVQTWKLSRRAAHDMCAHLLTMLAHANKIEEQGSYGIEPHEIDEVARAFEYWKRETDTAIEKWKAAPGGWPRDEEK